eukprot:CAMPEP_0170559666 /NCGR_PEP_ID=MMETSP0211-20121228/44326_1 /TAXON_ID=311385 /ORGANISM="Pseudokeronopsis sp., Strain OXSARD2" /LENGTH=76 /DNA_ID=CAMNT_0010873003 /DNA_START=1547 /DNA_END=1777 /DNA_ORIENTATION=-
MHEGGLYIRLVILDDLIAFKYNFVEEYKPEFWMNEDHDGYEFYPSSVHFHLAEVKRQREEEWLSYLTTTQKLEVPT